MGQIAALLFCLAPIQNTNALTIPVREDSYSSSKSTITSAYGKSGLLYANASHTAFVRFDISDYAGLIDATNVGHARLRIQLHKIIKPGAISIHKISSEWSEYPSSRRSAPSVNEDSLAIIQTNINDSFQFVEVNVTEVVRGWLNTENSDFGLAIKSEGIANITISSKEGSKFGSAAYLEIEKNK